MSDTPRTDKYTGLGFKACRLIDTSRQLERELAKANEQRDRLSTRLRIAEENARSWGKMAKDAESERQRLALNATIKSMDLRELIKPITPDPVFAPMRYKSETL